MHKHDYNLCKQDNMFEQDNDFCARLFILSNFWREQGNNFCSQDNLPKQENMHQQLLSYVHKIITSAYKVLIYGNKIIEQDK